MLVYAENEYLKISAETKVGELRSVTSKKTGKDYLWSGDPKFWEYTAPMVFPICSNVKDHKYRFGGKEYDLGKHGFMRFMELEVLESGKDKIVFKMTDTAETLPSYPFHFEMILTYALVGNTLKNTWVVTNTGTGDMYFSTGGHPAFSTTVNDGDQFNDYYIEFSGEETAEKMIIGPTAEFTGEKVVFLDGKKSFDLEHSLFANDAIFLSGLKSANVCLKNKKHDNYLEMVFKGFKYLGFWTKVGAPYICIEPWHSLGDFANFKGDFTEKPDITKLEEGKSFLSNYDIIIHE